MAPNTRTSRCYRHMAAVTGALTNCRHRSHFHFVLAFAYCCAPSPFSGSPGTGRNLWPSALRRLRFSLTSPAEMLIRELRMATLTGVRCSQQPCLLWRAPHNVALAMLPLAYLFLHRAIVRGGAWAWCWQAPSRAQWRSPTHSRFRRRAGAIAIVLALEPASAPCSFVGLCPTSGFLLAAAISHPLIRAQHGREGFFQADCAPNSPSRPPSRLRSSGS